MPAKRASVRVQDGFSADFHRHLLEPRFDARRKSAASASSVAIVRPESPERLRRCRQVGDDGPGIDLNLLDPDFTGRS